MRNKFIEPVRGCSSGQVRLMLMLSNKYAYGSNILSIRTIFFYNTIQSYDICLCNMARVIIRKITKLVNVILQGKYFGAYLLSCYKHTAFNVNASKKVFVLPDVFVSCLNMIFLINLFFLSTMWNANFSFEREGGERFLCFWNIFLIILHNN